MNWLDYWLKRKDLAARAKQCWPLWITLSFIFSHTKQRQQFSTQRLRNKKWLGIPFLPASPLGSKPASGKRSDILFVAVFLSRSTKCGVPISGLLNWRSADRYRSAKSCLIQTKMQRNCPMLWTPICEMPALKTILGRFNDSCPRGHLASRGVVMSWEPRLFLVHRAMEKIHDANMNQWCNESVMIQGLHNENARILQA